MKRVLTFLREFRDNFHLTGSLLPSSRFLAAALAKNLAAPGPKAVIEVGPGTGPVTEKILGHLRPGDRLVLVEASEAFCDVLEELARTRWKDRLAGIDFELRRCFIQDVPFANEFDYAVSGLPLNNFSREVVEQILSVLRRVLKPEGKLSYFEYQWVRPLKAAVTRYLGSMERTEVSRVLDAFIRDHEFDHDHVVLNVPPAVARHVSFSA